MAPDDPTPASRDDRPVRPARYRSRLLRRLMQDAEELDAFLTLDHDQAPAAGEDRVGVADAPASRVRDPARDGVLGSFLPVTGRATSDPDARRPRRG